MFEIFRNFRIFIYLLVISPSQIPLPDNIQDSQETNIRVPGEIPAHDFIKLSAADTNLRLGSAYTSFR